MHRAWRGTLRGLTASKVTSVARYGVKASGCALLEPQSVRWRIANGPGQEERLTGALVGAECAHTLWPTKSAGFRGSPACTGAPTRQALQQAQTAVQDPGRTTTECGGLRVSLGVPPGAVLQGYGRGGALGGGEVLHAGHARRRGNALTAFWVVAAALRSRGWIQEPSRRAVLGFVGVGVLITITFEWIATEILHRWAYAPSMPVLLGTGLLPVLQWVVLPPLIVGLVRRQLT